MLVGVREGEYEIGVQTEEKDCSAAGARKSLVHLEAEVGSG